MEATGTSIHNDSRACVISEIPTPGCERNKSILIVDDSESIRELLSVLLHEDGIVYTAFNGLDALSKFAANHFDVIVTDIEMPVMNGIELYNNVPPFYKDVFLFFSGTRNEGHIRYLTLNNLTLLRKPDDILKMRPAVQQKLKIPFPKIATK